MTVTHQYSSNTVSKLLNNILDWCSSLENEITLETKITVLPKKTMRVALAEDNSFLVYQSLKKIGPTIIEKIFDAFFQSSIWFQSSSPLLSGDINIA